MAGTEEAAKALDEGLERCLKWLCNHAWSRAHIRIERFEMNEKEIKHLVEHATGGNAVFISFQFKTCEMVEALCRLLEEKKDDLEFRHLVLERLPENPNHLIVSYTRAERADDTLITWFEHMYDTSDEGRPCHVSTTTLEAILRRHGLPTGLRDVVKTSRLFQDFLRKKTERAVHITYPDAKIQDPAFIFSYTKMPRREDA
jgi:hypothetical protein